MLEQARHLTHLELGSADDDTLEAFLGHPTTATLRHLTVRHSESEASQLARLRGLDLDYNDISDGGTQALRDAPGLGRLTSLSIASYE